MFDKAQVLEELLEAMISENETITIRAVCRRSDGVFKHATDITRNVKRQAAVDAAIKRQEAIRTAIDKSSKKSRSELERLVATKNDEISQLQADKELLIASHRAMILAVAEMGGFSTWRKFYDGYQAVIDRLDAMRAIPSGEVVALPPRKP